MLTRNFYVYILVLPFKMVRCSVWVVDDDVFGLTKQFHPTSCREELGPADVLKFPLERLVTLNYVC